MSRNHFWDDRLDPQVISTTATVTTVTINTVTTVTIREAISLKKTKKTV